MVAARALSEVRGDAVLLLLMNDWDRGVAYYIGGGGGKYEKR